MQLPLAQAIEGLKDDPIRPVSDGVSPLLGIGPLIQMLLALAVVVALIRWLVPKYLAKIGKRTGRAALNPEFQVLDSTLLGAATLHLVKVRGRTLVISTTPSHSSLIADLTEEPETLPYIPSGQTDVDSEPFAEVFGRLERLQGGKP